MEDEYLDSSYEDRTHIEDYNQYEENQLASERDDSDCAAISSEEMTDND